LKRLAAGLVALCGRETVLFVGTAVLVASCASGGPPVFGATEPGPDQTRAMIAHSIPPNVPDRAGWVTDIYSGFTVQGLVPTHENVCAVVAVIEQESNFQVNPVVPGLGAIAWKEIDNRAERAGLPRMIVHGAMGLKSSDGRTYDERIDAARTEKDLSDIYEDFIGSVPLGRRLFADWNPVRTRGPMQVNIAYAESYAAARPYPYPLKVSVADEVFTRRGSLYFGIAHLLAYQPPYNGYVFRFADFNAGQYSSRNAAFQNAVSKASGVPLVTDGALLSHEGGPSNTELALRALAGRLNVNEGDIHDALEQGKSKDLEHTKIYERVFALAEHVAKRPLPRALVPTITLHGPKLSRTLTTSWYAHRVEGRYEKCLGQ
jgi:hypothetical protein